MPTDYETMARQAAQKLQQDLRHYLHSVTVDSHRMARCNADELLTLLQEMAAWTPQK